MRPSNIVSGKVIEINLRKLIRVGQKINMCGFRPCNGPLQGCHAFLILSFQRIVKSRASYVHAFAMDSYELHMFIKFYKGFFFVSIKI